MKLLGLAIATLPILAKAMALGIAEGVPGEVHHLEARRPPTYPTKVTVRPRSPIYPTKVTVRARGEDTPSETTALEDSLEKRRPPKITLKTVRYKRDDGGDFPARGAAHSTVTTTVCDPAPPCQSAPLVSYMLGQRLC